MQDTLTTLTQIKRPAILMRAARLGAEDYRRNVHLPRLLGYGQMPRHNAALLRLIELEAEHNAQRLSDPSTYSLVRHLDVLIAIVAEARTLRAAASDHMNESGSAAFLRAT